MGVEVLGERGMKKIGGEKGTMGIRMEYKRETGEEGREKGGVEKGGSRIKEKG